MNSISRAQIKRTVFGKYQSHFPETPSCICTYLQQSHVLHLPVGSCWRVSLQLLLCSFSGRNLFSHWTNWSRSAVSPEYPDSTILKVLPSTVTFYVIAYYNRTVPLPRYLRDLLGEERQKRKNKGMHMVQYWQQEHQVSSVSSSCLRSARTGLGWELTLISRKTRCLHW